MATLHQTVKEIIDKRLINVPPIIKAEFPAIFSQLDMSYIRIINEKYLLIVFIDAVDKKRINEMLNQGYDPFPGLLTDDCIGKPVIAKMDNSKFSYFQYINVENMYLICYGKDSTVVIEDYMQSINIAGIGPYAYYIKLAYIIIFGDEINKDNAGEFLDDLISYSINKWRSPDVKRT
jgi:hypothetical protein